MGNVEEQANGATALPSTIEPDPEDLGEILRTREQVLHLKEAAENVAFRIEQVDAERARLVDEQRQARAGWVALERAMMDRMKLVAAKHGLDLDRDPDWKFDFARRAYVRRAEA